MESPFDPVQRINRSPPIFNFDAPAFDPHALTGSYSQGGWPGPGGIQPPAFAANGLHFAGTVTHPAWASSVQQQQALPLAGIPYSDQIMPQAGNPYVPQQPQEDRALLLAHNSYNSYPQQQHFGPPLQHPYHQQQFEYGPPLPRQPAHIPQPDFEQPVMRNGHSAARRLQIRPNL
mgnify:FL=1|jgi:hypothetical protein